MSEMSAARDFDLIAETVHECPTCRELGATPAHFFIPGETRRAVAREKRKAAAIPTDARRPRVRKRCPHVARALDILLLRGVELFIEGEGQLWSACARCQQNTMIEDGAA